ncbi:MBL fold metallo-hydrolase [Streptomyces sp. NPDC008222]|uniref:MBL fold metallo-hydrolase n=1 Tax=Streptomyces sp. NPDC008222 TaxID=3364820 RepID=UPI0036E089FB
MTVWWEEAGWEALGARAGRTRLPGWDCTAGLVVGEHGALMIDAGSSLGEGARLRTATRRLLAQLGGDLRVTHLALTHPHFDHVLGAAAFAGAEVFGAVGTDAVFVRERDVLVTDAVRHGLDAAEAAEAGDVLVRPHQQVSGERTLDLGGVQVLLAHLGPAHTAHDLVVLVPGERAVVFCGDLVEESGEPQAGPDAAPAHWPAALDRLLELGGRDAVYVPGHGAVVDAAFVRAQRDGLASRFGVS